MNVIDGGTLYSEFLIIVGLICLVCDLLTVKKKDENEILVLLSTIILNILFIVVILIILNQSF